MARKNRSSWKGSYVNPTLWNDVRALNRIMKTDDRASTILPSMRGAKIYVYSGKYYIPVHITASMIGQKLGSFVTTTKIGSQIHLTKKNLKKKKKK